jgi:hypothetical protein
VTYQAFVNQETGEFFSETQPRHWTDLTGSGALTEAKMTQTAGFVADGTVLRIKFKFLCWHWRCKDSKRVATHQEIPAVFLERDFGTLIVSHNDGDSRRYNNLGEKNWYLSKDASRSDSVAFYAFCNDGDGRCVGVKSPSATDMTAYRVSEPGMAGSCSYLAPIASIQLPDRYEYTTYFTIGTLEQIKQRFRSGDLDQSSALI